MTRDSEVARLDAVAERYDPTSADEFDRHGKRIISRLLLDQVQGPKVLEMGCATGELTRLLASHFDRYEVVEGSGHNIARARALSPSAGFHESLWEEFRPTDPYDDILCICALEHCEDPVSVLDHARSWTTSGRLHVVVPNAESIHRLVGVELGMLENIHELSDSDIRIGHRRVYDTDSLHADITRAGWRIEATNPVMLKPLSGGQMLDWPDDLIDALHAVAGHIPRHAAELYVRASLATPPT